MTGVEFLGVEFTPLNAPAVEEWLAERPATAPFAYIVTPNVDHLVRLAGETEEVRRAYADADLCLCDSRVVARLAKLCGVRLPVVAGSDLTAALFARVLRPGDTICLIGGSAADVARLRTLHPTIGIVHYEAPMGLRIDVAARRAAVQAAAAAAARFTLLAVGSPQQELLARELADDPSIHGTALCIGASVEFLTGTQKRAPRAWQRLGVEWAWRLATNPRRLARRYLVEGPAIFPMVWRWRRDRQRRAA